jgi:hypothetical protein
MIIMKILAVLVPLSAICVDGSVIARQANTTLRETNTNSPCAKASSASAAYVAAFPSATSAFIAPSLAVACLQSVPLDVERDIVLLEKLGPYLQFQSTLDFLKNPPRGYLVPGVDIPDSLQQIKRDLLSGGYLGQWEFANELRKLVPRLAGFLFVYIADTMSSFQKPPMAISTTPSILSGYSPFVDLTHLFTSPKMGLCYPKFTTLASRRKTTPKGPNLLTCNLGDFYKAKQQGYVLSDIESIDGVPILEHLEQLAATTSYHDPDAQFNSLFETIPLRAMTRVAPSGGYNIGNYLSLPDESIVTYSNGTAIGIKNIAEISLGLLDGIGSGEALHAKYGIPQPRTPSPTASLGTRQSPEQPAPPTTAVPEYPKPVVIHPQGGWISGYFLDSNDTKFKDTAVLSIFSFEGPNRSDPLRDVLGAQKLLSDFLALCTASGKKRLIIDLSSNPGGYIFIAYDYFKQFFPNAEIWGGNRLRATDTLDWIGTNLFNLSTESAPSLIVTALDRNLQPFTSWSALFGPDPQPAGGDSVTNLIRWNHALSPDGIIMSGFDKQRPLPPQVFAPEDITIITDGVCASTCTTLVTQMTRQKGVRTVAIGGRPLHLPMQAMGGVKGEIVMRFDQIQDMVKTVLTNVTNGTAPANVAIPSLDDFPLLPSLSSGSINLRNAYPRNDSSGIPEQFLYQAANCRIFHTAETLTSIEKMWMRVADIAWRGGKCAPGSTVHDDGTMGWASPEYFDAVMSGIQPTGLTGSPGDSGTEAGSGSGNATVGRSRAGS